MLAQVKSKLGNTCAYVFTNRCFTIAIPMSGCTDAAKSLIDFTDDVGIPEDLVTDGAGEFTGKNMESLKEARQMRIRLHTTESGRHNQNHAAEWRSCTWASAGDCKWTRSKYLQGFGTLDLCTKVHS